MGIQRVRTRTRYKMYQTRQHTKKNRLTAKTSRWGRLGQGSVHYVIVVLSTNKKAKPAWLIKAKKEMLQ